MSSEDELDDSTDPFTLVTRHKRCRHDSHNSRSSEAIISNVMLRNTLTVIVKPTDSSKLITKLNPLVLSVSGRRSS